MGISIANYTPKAMKHFLMHIFYNCTYLLNEHLLLPDSISNDNNNNNYQTNYTTEPYLDTYWKHNNFWSYITTKMNNKFIDTESRFINPSLYNKNNKNNNFFKNVIQYNHLTSESKFPLQTTRSRPLFIFSFAPTCIQICKRWNLCGFFLHFSRAFHNYTTFWSFFFLQNAQTLSHQ